MKNRERILLLSILLLLGSALSLELIYPMIADASTPSSPSVFSCVDVDEIPQDECEALVHLYNETNGGNWTLGVGWLETTTPCGWHGITCRDGKVTRLILDINNLQGTIPVEIGDLQHLQYLNLSENSLSGELPTTLTTLSTLVDLSLNDNGLSGPLPIGIEALTNLEKLSLYNTQLSGELPTVLMNLPSLEALLFQNTALCIPNDQPFLDWLESISVMWTEEQICFAEGGIYEENNTCTSAKTLPTTGDVQRHSFHTEDDEDWARFDVVKDVTYLIEGEITDESTADLSIELYDSCGEGAQLLVEQKHAFTPAVRKMFRATYTGSLYMRVMNENSGVNNSGVDNSGYRLSAYGITETAFDGAAIIVAGRKGRNDEVLENIYHVADEVYQFFTESALTDENIRYLSHDADRPGVDLPATKDNLEASIKSWAAGRLRTNSTLTLYFVDHGDPDQFYLERSEGEWFSPNDLDQWLSTLETLVPGVKIVVIIEACYAGSFIETEQSISRGKRIVVTSTGSTNLAYAITGGGAVFSDQFLNALKRGSSLYAAFEFARQAVKRSGQPQTPWIDSSGEGDHNQEIDQAGASESYYIGIPTAISELPAEMWAPVIEEAGILSSFVSDSRAIQATVVDDKSVERVWAVIYPPSYIPPDTQSGFVVEDQLPTVDLVKGTGNTYEVTYEFYEVGKYRIVIHAIDDDGMSAQPLEIEKWVDGEQLFFPVIS